MKELDAGKCCVLATVVEKSGDGPVVLGGKILLSSSGTRYGTIGGGALEAGIIKTCQRIMASGENQMLIYDLSDCGGSAKIFYEYYEPNPSVLVFGAGNVGREVIKKLEGTGFKVAVIDPVCPTGIPYDSYYRDYHEVVQALITPESYVVLATSSHETDYQVLKTIVQLPVLPKYLGMLASKKKRKELVQRLKDEVGKVPDALYSPIGLNLGGGTPAEIGIAIVAQIIAKKYAINHVEDMSADD